MLMSHLRYIYIFRDNTDRFTVADDENDIAILISLLVSGCLCCVRYRGSHFTDINSRMTTLPGKEKKTNDKTINSSIDNANK